VNSPANAVALWGTTADVLADPAVSAYRLTCTEEHRGERLVRRRDRDAFRAAHLLARVCGSRIGLSSDVLELRQQCPTCGEGHGVPRFRDAPHVRVSIAHTRGAVIAAVSLTAIGVDIEPIRAVQLADIAPVLSAAEAAWLRSNPDDAIRIWCRKEAAAKAAEAGVSAMRRANALTGSWTEETADGFQMCIATESPIVLSRIAASTVI
jgi:4'-phosphopantetheinyl transferase